MAADTGIHIALFAKAPVAGKAKTRLIPALGPQGAAQLSGLLLEHALAQAVMARPAQVQLWCAPDVEHPLFAALSARHNTSLHTQCEGDIGARMNDAFMQHFAGSNVPLLLMGSDCPGLDAPLLAKAARALQGGADIVLVPALDGGYGLIGLAAPAPVLFADMPWSTGQVREATLQRAAASGLRLVQLAAVADIDRPEDLGHLPVGMVSALARWLAPRADQA